MWTGMHACIELSCENGALPSQPASWSPHLESLSSRPTVSLLLVSNPHGPSWSVSCSILVTLILYAIKGTMHASSHVRIQSALCARRFVIPDHQPSVLQLPFPLEQFQHLPNPYYPRDALRDSLVRTNIVNLDLASPPPPQRTNPRSHPLTPPDTPGNRRSDAIHVQYDEEEEKTSEHGGQLEGIKLSTLEHFRSLGLVVNGNKNATRYLVVGGVPPSASTAVLSQTFCVRVRSCIRSLMDRHCRGWVPSRECLFAI